MSRKNLWPSACGAFVSMVVAVLLSSPALGQEAEPAPPQPAAKPGAGEQARPPKKPPTTQPNIDESFRKLEELRKQKEKELREKRKKPATSSERPPERQTLEDLRKQARASTQEAPGQATSPTGEAVEKEEEEFGPPYPPATPATKKPQREVPVRKPERPAPEPAAEEKPEPRSAPVSRATDDLEWFNFVNTPWEDVIAYFVERIGKPLMVPEGELIIGGELTYVSDRKFTKEEALDELNLIMHMIEYRFVETERHIFVVPLYEMRTYIDAEETYPSREVFEAADLRPTDWVAVFVLVKDQPAKAVQLMFENMVGDYMTVLALEDSNQLKLVGLVQDIRKILSLMDRIKIEENDPRQMRIFEVKTNARDIERLLQEFLGTRPAAVSRLRRDPRTGKMVPTAAAAPRVQSEVRIVADDRTNTIIVKATPSRMKEIEKLIESFDQRPELDFKTEVIEIMHANAVEVAELLSKIFSQEQGQTTPAWQRLRAAQQRAAARQRGQRGQRTPRRTTRQTQQPSPEELLGIGAFERAKKTIRIAADERTNSIIVYANKEGHERVHKLLATIDRAQPSNFRTIKLEQVEAAKIHGTVSQVAQNLASKGGRAASVVLDEPNNQFYIIAEREAMTQIVEVIAKLDVPMPEPERHVVELENILPSQVAQMIRPLLTSGAAGAPGLTSRLRGRMPRRGRRTPQPSVTADRDVQIIALDEAMTLIVICSAEDWAKVEDTIKLWDERAVSNTPELQTIAVKHGDAQAIAATLSNMYRTYQHPTLGRSQVLIQAEGNSILVYGVKPAQEEIAPLIEALDTEDASQYEILPLAHANASQVAQEAMNLFGGGAVRGRMQRGGGGSRVVIQAEPVTNSLIVQADAATMEKIKDFAQQRDQAVAAQLPEQKFFTLRYAQPREVASAVQTMFGSGARRRGAPVGTQIKAVASGPQVIIEAPKEKMPEIEAFIAQLDDPKGNEIVIKTIKLSGADVQQIATRLSNAFRAKRNVIARFDPDPQAETILLTCSKTALEEAERLISEYETNARGQTPQVEFVQMRFAQATTASTWLREQLITYMQQQWGRRAASLIRVTADARTNRVVINGPEVAVKYGKTLLEQYDEEVTQAVVTVMQTEARKLPGLDVRVLATQLNRVFSADPPRPDRLRATFSADATTETLIVSAPKDMYERINGIIATFEEETKNLEPEQRFIAVKEADANYIASQVRNLLGVQMRRTRGTRVADRITISVDTRRNEIIINAPKFVIPIAEELIARLDQPAIGQSQLRTIALEYADAGTVYNVLRNIFNEKIRARTLQVSVEPMTNSLIVGGSDEDFEDIEKWAKELDDAAVVKGLELEIIDLVNASPWDVINILNVQFGAQRRGGRSRVGHEIRFSVVAGRSIVAQAPKDKMPDIKELIARLDLVGVDKVQVRTYELPGIGSGIHDLARNVTNAMNQQITGRERRVSISAYPAADTLIVTARTDQFEQIEEMMDQFKDMVSRETTVTRFIELEYLDASRYAAMIQNMLASKISREGRRGSRALQNLQIIADPRTNRLICYLPEKIVPDLEEVITQLDVEAVNYEGQLRTIPLSYADANTVANVLRPMFEQRRNVQRGQNISQIIVRIQAEPITNSLLVTASDEDFEQIEARALEIDEGALVRKADPVLIRLEFADPWQVRNVINSAFTESGLRWGTRRNVQSEVNVTVVGANLLVQAPKEKLEDVQKLIETLDVPGTEELMLKTFVLPGMGWELNSLAGNIQRMLQQMTPRGRSQARASIWAYPQTDTIIVSVPAKQMKDVEELIETLTAGGMDMTPITQFYTLEFARANEIVGTLNQIVQMRVSRMQGGGRRAQQQLSVVPDNRTNRLAVTAPEKIQAEVERVITNLDVPPEVNIGELRSVPLVNADASMLCGTLRPLFQEKARQRRADKSYIPLTLTPETITNTVLAYGGDEADQQLLDREIARIDSSVDEFELKPVTIELKYADPHQIVQLINAMFGSRGRRGQSQQQQVQAQVSNGLLVVKAPKKKLAEIRGLVAEVDAEDTTQLQIKTYQLKVLNASEVARQVQLYLRSIQTVQRRGQMQPGAFPETTTNTLVVIAPADHLPFIDSLIAKLETSDRPESEARTYVLTNARADQVARNVETMLRAKVTEREGQVRSRTLQTAVFSDAATNRLFVYAPEEYQALAAELIRMVDEEVDTGELVHIIQLEQADATQLARTLQQVMQQGARGRGVQATRQVSITADAGSNSILLAGLPKDVAKVEGYIEDLEQTTDIIPELQIFQLEHADALDVAETLEQLFGAGGQRRGRGRGRQATPMDTVTITPDEYYNRLLVTASLRKMRQVEAVVEQLDADMTPEGGDILADNRGRVLYFIDVNRGDPFDIAWEVRDMLPDEEKGGPVVEADWFGKYIKVRCRPNQFEQVLALIRRIEENVRVERKIVIRIFRGDTAAMLAFLRERMDEDELDIERLGTTEKPTIVETLWEEGEEPPGVNRKKERQQPEEPRGASGSRVRPFQLGLPVSVALLEDVDGLLFDDEPPVRPRKPEQAEEQAAPEPAAAGPGSRQPTTAPAGGRVSATPKEKTRIVVKPDGSLIIYGPEDDVEEIEEVIDLLEEDLDVGEVIRIFEFRYGDVSAAAEVVNIMFNERQTLRLPQQQQQQRGRQPQQRGREGRDQQGGMMEQMQRMMGQQRDPRRQRTDSRRVRIATDPSHNYLIVKCNEADLPEIRQLLRELDIPPGEVDLRVFQLKNLDANETAENIKDVLGINKAQQRRGGTRQMPRGRTRRGPQQQLMEMLQQQAFSVPGVEGGAKVERVEIVPNAITNSLMVSAPPEVMTIIENIINELEGLEGRGVTGIYHYPLEKAKVDDVLPLLQEIFAAAGGGGAGGPRGRGRARGASPGAMGPVTISGDPRNNTIIFTAEAKDVETIERHIMMLDVEGAIAEAETYICLYGDAVAIADVVDAIYGGGGRQSGQRRRGQPGAAPIAGREVRIVAEPTTQTIFVYGPRDKRDVIMEKIQQLDFDSRRDIREIDLIYADPEKLAETLLGMFGGGGGQQVRRTGRQPRRGQRPSATGSGNLMIIGDKNAKKLLVRAPDPVFEQIQEMVKTLDQPDERMKIQQFTLQYAEAEVVVEQVRSALTEYLQMYGAASGRGRGGGDLPFDPFTVLADPRLNTIMVVGSDQTFAFVEGLLGQIDVETPDAQRNDFRVYVLEKADAETVAQAINDFAMGQTSATGQRAGRQPRGRGRGPSAAAAGAGRLLDVYATAEPTANTVLVSGKAEDIDRVEDAIINQMEDKISQRIQFATIAVENMKPSKIVSYIRQFLGQPEGPDRRATGRSQRGGTTETVRLHMVPNDNAQTLMVRGTRGDIEEVRDLVAQFDVDTLTVDPIKVVKVPFGQDVARLAGDIERILNAYEEDQQEITGLQPRRVSISPDEYTNTLMVAGDPSMHALVESLVTQLADIKDEHQVTRVVQLVNLASDDVQQLIEDLQRRGASGGRGSIRGGTRRRTPTQRSTPSRRPRRRGDASWPQMRGVEESPWRSQPVAWLSPYVSVVMVQPAAGLALVDQLLQDDDEPPKKPEAQGRPGDEDQDQPELKRQLERMRRLQGKAAAEEEEQPADGADRQPTSAPVEGLTGVQGELRGEVTARPVDSKRIIISGDESDVDFIMQILAMMERSASAALIEVFALENTKATVLAPIIETAIQAQIDIRTSSPGPADRFSINAEARGNALIVSASEEMMEQIAELIGHLDVERPEGMTDIRALALRHIRASDAVAKVRPIIEKLNQQREVPSDAQASVDPDDRSNSVLIVGTPKDVEEIERLLETIDVEIKDEEQRRSFVRADAILIQVKNAQAEDIAKVLTDMIEAEQDAAREAQRDGDRAGRPYVSIIRLRLPDGRELPELDLERPIRIIAEKGTNSLIIFSTPDNNQALTEIVEVFDTLPIGADTDVRAIALLHANAEEVATLLDDVFSDKSPIKRPSEGDSKSAEKGVLPVVPSSLTGRGLPYNIVINHDVRSNTVIVVGRREAVLLAASLIAELDKPTADLGLRPYVIALKNMTATALAERLTELFDERAKALGADQNAARDGAVIQADDRTNKLVILASAEVIDMVEDLALELDSAEKYTTVATQFRRLGYADAQKLQGLVQELFDRKQEAEREQSKDSKDSLAVIADVRSNSLIMTGTRDYLTEADAVIDNLDQKFDPTVVFKVRPIKLNVALNVATLLREMVDEALQEQESKLKGTPMHIAADPLSNSLLLAASEEDMTLLERWVEILDRPSEFGRMMQIVPLSRASAEEVATAATDIFKVEGGDIDVTVTHDAATNSIVAFAPPALLQDIVNFVRQLDQTEAGNSAIVRIFKLDQADAERAEELLSSILEGRGGAVGGRGGGGGGRGSEEIEKQVVLMLQNEHPEAGIETLRAMRSDVVVIADIRTNSLVVTAPPESMGLMESLIAQIDMPPDAARIRTFTLVNADAEQMVEMLNELFEQQQAGAGRGDDESERVLGGVGGREEVSFTTDVRTNSVIAAGTPGYLDLVEDLILDLDSRPIEDRTTFVYAPRNMVADTLAAALRDYSDQEQSLLQELGDEISLARRQEHELLVVAHEESNRIIVGVSPRFENEILDIVRELDQPPPQVSIEVLIVEVAMGSSLELGVEFAFQDLQYTKAGPSDTNTFDFVGGTDVGAAGAGLGGFTFTITGRDFNFLLRTLQSENSLNVLSRPHIVAMDNQLASIEITDSIPYVTGSQTTIGGSVQTSVTRQNVGIKLEVTPQINPDGYVRLEIRQEVSDLSDSTISVGQGLTAPIFHEQIAETVVTVLDNETVVLGGLIQSRDSKSEQKIPIMGDIPLIGPLFRFQNDDERRSELLIIMTPRVVRTVEDFRELSMLARDQTGLIPDEVKTNPLMRGLQVRPEELIPLDGEDLLGPLNGLGPEPEQGAGPEEYGPARPNQAPMRKSGTGSDPNSYDVPISMLSRKQ